MNCVETGVGHLLHWNYIENRNIMGKGFIEPKEQIKIQFSFEVEVKKKLARMYMGISPATTYNGYWCFEDLAECHLHNLLNTNYPGQLLPPLVVIPVIGDMNKIAQWKNYLFANIVLWNHEGLKVTDSRYF